LGVVRSAAAKPEGYAELPLYGTTKLQLAAMTDEELVKYQAIDSSCLRGTLGFYKGSYNLCPGVSLDVT